MQHPYGDDGSSVTSLSVTAKRPTGVGVDGPPIATGKRITTRPERLTTIWRCRSDAEIDHGVRYATSAAFTEIHPIRPFGSADEITPSHEPR